MPWNSPNGGGDGPWGGDGGPWGGSGSKRGRETGKGGGNKGGGFGGGNNLPPDIDELIRKGQERFRALLPPSFSQKGAILGLAALVLAWAATGIYRVNTDEQGVVLRFGHWIDVTQPGLHYHLPAPFESVITPKVTRVNRIELGYRSSGEPVGHGASSRDLSTESRMLTGDENLIEISFAVTWRIKDAGEYLFNIRDPEGTVRVAAESAIRDVIGQSPIQSALNVGQQQIADRTRELLQNLLNEYHSGVEVVQIQLQRIEPPPVVVDAFNDVQRAKADQERVGNEAEAYRNDIIPRARGEAQRLVQEASAYKEQIVDLAQGDAKRFLSVLTAYRQNREVTAERLYIETMEEVLKGSTKVIIEPSAQGGQGVVPYLPLPDLKSLATSKATAPNASSSTSSSTGYPPSGLPLPGQSSGPSTAGGAK